MPLPVVWVWDMANGSDRIHRSKADRVHRSKEDAVASALYALQVVIPHRNPPLTRAALKYAASLAAGLNLRIRFIDVHVVPYGVPPDKPPVDPKRLRRRIRQLALESAVPVSAE